MRTCRSIASVIGVLVVASVIASGPGAPRYKRLFRTWKDNPHASHTFFTPSAIGLPRGNGYYQNNYVLMHSAWFAPLDGLSIGAGFQMMTVLASMRKGQDKLPGGFVALKANKRFWPGVHGGLFVMGSQLSTKPSIGDTASLGNRIATVMAQATFGTAECHVTISAGSHYTMGRFTEDPQFGISGQWRFTEAWGVVSENWLLDLGLKKMPICSAGIRFYHRKLAADVAAVYNKDLAKGFGPVIPYFGFALRF
ncbi:MAG: hypothetical protein JST41_11370 [Bacteroidetes bacterium]|jgi:hypothetical protein|nr:hypothetical protein [Bacteroidota bacterium]MBX7129651.1 hypothetical protein [Flavobacteriales bacterium]MCC6654014.1 hypothetical protein [Flavobacteriales bacterium]HMU13855.1 hypothetical protein [Flavobacteriales bacterium]HNM70277.1 hypothetical protein [Flavobacteriales bacterium]